MTKKNPEIPTSASGAPPDWLLKQLAESSTWAEARRREALGWPNPQFTLSGQAPPGYADQWLRANPSMSIPGSTAIWRDDPFAPKPPAPMPESRGRFSELDW